MPTRTAPHRSRRRPLRSPLAAAPHSSLPAPRAAAGTDRATLPAAVPDARSLTLAEFRDYLPMAWPRRARSAGWSPKRRWRC